MSDLTGNLLVRLSAPLGAFVAWWIQEVRDYLEALLARFAPGFVTSLFVRVDRVGGEVWMMRGKERQHVQRLDLGAANGWVSELGGAELAQPLRGVRAVFSLAPELVLTLPLRLPSAVEGDLARVVSLHLERESPSPPGRVCFDYRIVRRSRAERRIEVQILLAHRTHVEQLQRLARKWGVRLARVGVAAGETQIRGNFLHPSTRFEQLRFKAVDRWLGAAAATLTAGVAVLIGAQWAHERYEVGREVQRLTAHAAAADRLRHHLAAEGEPLEELASLMNRPDALDGLTTLTAQIPLDSWVYDLDVTAQSGGVPQIKLAAFSPAATSLVELLGKSGQLEKVRLVSAMSAGLGSTRDRVQLTAELATHGSTSSVAPRTPSRAGGLPAAADGGDGEHAWR